MSIKKVSKPSELKENSIKQNSLNHADLSVIVPVCNEAAGLKKFLTELVDTLEGHGVRFEIIIIEDGSTDDTWEAVIRESSDPRIRGYRLSRNFGHQNAIMAGLRESRGKYVGIMDGDGQDPPGILVELYKKMPDYDVAYAVRQKRREKCFKRISCFIFYRFFKMIVSFAPPLDAGDFSVMRREVANFIASQNYPNPYIRGLRAWWGGKQAGIPYSRPERAAGSTKYSYIKLFFLAISGIFSFSSLPFRVAIASGIVISVSGAGIGLFNIARISYIIPDMNIFLLAVIAFVGGLQIMVLGVVGEYIYNYFEGSREIPQYIIKDKT